jgi:hypothetical protein
MAEEDLDSDLEFRINILEVRMKYVMCRVEGSHVLLFNLRQRVEKLGTFCKDVQERGGFVSGSEVQQKVGSRTAAKLTEALHGDMQTQNESVDGMAERKYREISDAIIEIEKQVKARTVNVENRLEAAGLSVHSLQQTERGSREHEHLIEYDEKSEGRSARLGYSDESGCHMIENPGQLKAGKEAEEPREAKDVGIRQQMDECGKKPIVLIQEVRQLKEAVEIDPVKAAEYNDKGNGLDKKLNVKGTVESEGEKKSEDVKREINEFQLKFAEIAGNEPTELTDLEKEPKMEMSDEMVHGINRRTYRRESYVGAENSKCGLTEESRNVLVDEEEQRYCVLDSTEIKESLEDIVSVISNELAIQEFKGGRMQEEKAQSKADEEEEVEPDSTLEIAQIEGRFEESELNTSEELERRLSEDAKKREEIIQSRIDNALKLMILNIENKMNARMPNDLRKSVGESFRNVVNLSLTDLKLNIHWLECELVTSRGLRSWHQDEMRRLYTEFIKQTRKENSFRECIYVLEEELNNSRIMLNGAEDYARQLIETYDEVTLNIELEMQKHRTMCEDYRNLRSKYEKLKAKCESTAKSEGGCEIADQAIAEADKGQKDNRCPATDLEKQMSLLVRSHRELKRKVLSFYDVPRVIGRLQAEEVEDSESLDKYRKELMDVLKREPYLRFELMETALMRAKEDHVSTVTRPCPWTGKGSELKQRGRPNANMYVNQ